MKIIFLQTGGGLVEHAPIFESEAQLRAWLPAHAASCYCGEFMGGKKRTPAERMTAFLEDYEMPDTPNGRWAAAVAWAVDKGRSEWAIGTRECDHVDAEGRAISPQATFIHLNEEYAASVAP